MLTIFLLNFQEFLTKMLKLLSFKLSKLTLTSAFLHDLSISLLTMPGLLLLVIMSPPSPIQSDALQGSVLVLLFSNICNINDLPIVGYKSRMQQQMSLKGCSLGNYDMVVNPISQRHLPATSDFMLDD